MFGDKLKHIENEQVYLAKVARRTWRFLLTLTLRTFNLSAVARVNVSVKSVSSYCCNFGVQQDIGL